jgi:hypothetical protein
VEKRGYGSDEGICKKDKIKNLKGFHVKLRYKKERFGSWLALSSNRSPYSFASPPFDGFALFTSIKDEFLSEDAFSVKLQNFHVNTILFTPEELDPKPLQRSPYLFHIINRHS